MPDRLLRQIVTLAAYALPATVAQKAAHRALGEALGHEDPAATVDALRGMGRTWDVSTWASRRAFKLARSVEARLAEQEARAAESAVNDARLPAAQGLGTLARR